MRRVWVAVAAAALSFGIVACGGEPTPAVDAGTGGGGGGGGGGGSTDAGKDAGMTVMDAGMDAGMTTLDAGTEMDAGAVFSDPGTNPVGGFSANNGWGFAVADGASLSALGAHTVVLVENAADITPFCRGGIPSRYAAATVDTGDATGATVPSGAYDVATGAGIIDIGFPGATYELASTGNVTVASYSPSNISGSFEGTGFNTPGSVMGTFDVPACPTVTGVGANTVDGQIGFQPTNAVAYSNPNGQIWIVLTTDDQTTNVCMGGDPQSLRSASVVIIPTDIANPVGTYAADGMSGIVLVDTYENGAFTISNESYEGTITVSGFANNTITGTYQANLQTDFEYVASVSGSFAAPLCP